MAKTEEYLKSLGIEEFFELCKRIRYGWVDDGGQVFDAPDYSRYGLQMPQETVERGYGICWDQTELQRFWFKENDYKFKTFLLYYYVSDDYCPSHSFLTYFDDNKWCWFEPMFHETKVKHCGIYQYDSLDELLADVIQKYAEVAIAEGMLPRGLKRQNWNLYEYESPEFGASDREFYEYCRKGKKIL